MKKLILSAVALFGFAFFAQGQEIAKNALGLRFGDNHGFGGEISYQRGLSSNNRLEVDLGWRNSNRTNAYKIVGVYQWVWHIEGGFNWYAGAGGGVGSWSFRDKNLDVKENGTFLLLAGQIGIEYGFREIPLLLSLDFRPELYFGDGWRGDDFGPDIALGIRFKFN